MSLKVYLSPSSQTDNIYSYGSYTEAEVCRGIAEITYDLLCDVSGITPKLATDGKTVSGRVSESNSFGADLHIPIHTNAGGGDGTLVMCYTGNTSNAYVKAIYNSVAELTPTNDDGIKENTSLAEITGTTGTCVYLEVEFHDNETYAKWIVEHKQEIAQAIVDGIVEGMGGTSSTTTTSTTVTTTATTATATTETLTVDGYWGTKTTKRLQAIFGTTQDGEVSNQYKAYKSQNPGLDSGWDWQTNPTGYSPLIKAIQKKVGATQDGYIGPNTIKAIQKWMGTTQDGYFSAPSTCIKALQKWCNNQ